MPVTLLFLVLYLTLMFSGASGSAQETHLRVCFLSRRDRTFSSLMDMLMKFLPLLLPQKDHLVLAANFVTLGLMLARILASPAGKKSSRWQSCTLLCIGRDQVWVAGLEKANTRGVRSSFCHWKSTNPKIWRSKEYTENSAE